MGTVFTGGTYSELADYHFALVIIVVRFSYLSGEIVVAGQMNPTG